ncbi:MAG: hypothetical protein ACREUW_16290 [Burkholderiales bacterium]
MDVKGSAAKAPVSPEQRRYAAVLEVGVRIGFLLLVAAFLAYAVALTPAHVPLARLPELWTLPAHEYVRAAGLPTGWGWTLLLPAGELLALAAIGVLAGVSIVCFCVLLPVYRARRDHVYLGIVVLEIAVLLLAASGVLTAGH